MTKIRLKSSVFLIFLASLIGSIVLENCLYFNYSGNNVSKPKQGLVKAVFSQPEEKIGADMIARRIKSASQITPGNFMVEIAYISQMLGIKDYERVIQIFRTSLDPVAFVEGLQKDTGKSTKDVLTALDSIAFFKRIAANYRLRESGSLDAREFQNTRIDVGVSSGNYQVQGEQKDVAGAPLSEYLRLMREDAQDVPFVFRDDMENFVGRFLGKSVAEQDTPDLLDMVSKIESYLQNIDLGKIKYVITSGIGANEMYSHQLAAIVNAYSKKAGKEVKWIVANNPAHLEIIPSDANNDNTVVFEMSRSGGTKETVDFFDATKDRFKKRVVASNPPNKPTDITLYTKADKLKLDPDAKVLLIDDTRGDIGGRQMNRKTLMVYAPLYLALSSSLGNTAEAQEFLKYYANELLSANNELAYGNGLNSASVKLAEFLFRHRESGRNKFSVIYDNSLKATATELFQLLNEGANKNIAGGTNNNILDSYSFSDDKSRYDEIFTKAPDAQLPVFLLNKNGSGYSDALRYIEALKAKGIPAIVVQAELSDGLNDNLKTIARTSALLQDMVVYFTYITNQDANSNPAVKFVREITSAMFEILKDKKAGASTDIKMTFEDVLRKIEEKQRVAQTAAKQAIDRRNAQREPYRGEFDTFRDSIKALAITLGFSETNATSTLIKAISKTVVQTDVGEAGGSKIQEISEAFSRAGINSLLGALSADSVISPLNKQIVLESNSRMKISVAAKDNSLQAVSGSLAEKLAEYLFSMYKEKPLMYVPLTFMEVDQENPEIKEIAQKITDTFASLNITVPMLALPKVAHQGIEAVMSHPENVFNIAIVYTDTYGQGLGTSLIEPNVTIDDATYVYGIANVVRMAVGGTASIIFEVKNREDLANIRKILDDTLAAFRKKISP